MAVTLVFVVIIVIVVIIVRLLLLIPLLITISTYPLKGLMQKRLSILTGSTPVCCLGCVTR
jgi:hypothetical protein